MRRWRRSRPGRELRPAVGVVLGSGLGGFADAVETAVEIPYAEIPGWPSSTAVGHAGTLVVGVFGGVPVAVMKGRAHLYEGHSPAKVVFGVRVLGRLGIGSLVLTNACGALDAGLEPGTLVAIADHINLQGTSPLVGPNDDALGPRFPDMTDAYDAEYRTVAREAAARLGIALGEGVYAAWLGPAFETPAEIRMMRAARRRSRRDVDCAGGARRASHGDPLPRALVRHQRRRRASCPSPSTTSACSRSARTPRRISSRCSAR